MIRRMTGGGSVYHAYDGEAAYGVIVKERALENGLIFNAKEARKTCKDTLGAIPILSLILVTQKANPLEFSSHQGARFYS
jgi:lipoate-protein ligase A